jgi:hypothetical protein
MIFIYFLPETEMLLYLSSEQDRILAGLHGEISALTQKCSGTIGLILQMDIYFLFKSKIIFFRKKAYATLP